ncbi:hypothetical protein FKM82_028012 [Ascaphus truei]
MFNSILVSFTSCRVCGSSFFLCLAERVCNLVWSVTIFASLSFFRLAVIFMRVPRRVALCASQRTRCEETEPAFTLKNWSISLPTVSQISGIFRMDSFSFQFVPGLPV